MERREQYRQAVLAVERGTRASRVMYDTPQLSFLPLQSEAEAGALRDGGPVPVQSEALLPDLKVRFRLQPAVYYPVSIQVFKNLGE